MKKSYLLKFVLNMFIVLSVSVLSCKDNDKNDEGDYICQSSTILEESFNACCTNIQCYYEYDGQKYWCDGTDCSEAAQDLANDIIAINTAIINEGEVAILKNKILGLKTNSD